MVSQCSAFLNYLLPSLCAQKNAPYTVIIKGKTVDIIVPKRPLAVGSVQIAQNPNSTEQIDQKEVYQLLQRVIQVFEKQQITDYLRYIKASSPPIFNWEIVPYSKNSWSFWQQFKVLWNVTFGGLYFSQNHKQLLVKTFQEMELKDLQKTQPSIKQDSRNDAFCDKNIIDKQWVFKGNRITILYNYAPIGLGKTKLHFLLVPNQHREKFSDLTEEEYREVIDLSEKLITFYKNHSKEGLSAYLFDKTGAHAGQVVAHWHQHIVFTTTKIQGIWGKLTVLKNMIFGSSALSNEKLEKKVTLFRKEFKDLS